MPNPIIAPDRVPAEGDFCPNCHAEWCKNPHGELAILHLEPDCWGPKYQTVPLQPQTKTSHK